MSDSSQNTLCAQICLRRSKSTFAFSFRASYLADIRVLLLLLFVIETFSNYEKSCDVQEYHPLLGVVHWKTLFSSKRIYQVVIRRRHPLSVARREAWDFMKVAKHDKVRGIKGWYVGLKTRPSLQELNHLWDSRECFRKNFYSAKGFDSPLRGNKPLYD